MLDFIINNPSLREQLMPGMITKSDEDRYADLLFDVWKESDGKISDKVFKKPASLSRKDEEFLQRNGVANVVGDRVHITSKGQSVLKVLILGDERSAFEDDGTNPQFKAAKAKMKRETLKDKTKKAENDWWKRFQ